MGTPAGLSWTLTHHLNHVGGELSAAKVPRDHSPWARTARKTLSTHLHQEAFLGIAKYSFPVYLTVVKTLEMLLKKYLRSIDSLKTIQLILNAEGIKERGRVKLKVSAGTVRRVAVVSCFDSAWRDRALHHPSRCPDPALVTPSSPSHSPRVPAPVPADPPLSYHQGGTASLSQGPQNYLQDQRPPSTVRSTCSSTRPTSTCPCLPTLTRCCGLEELCQLFPSPTSGEGTC